MSSWFTGATIDKMCSGPFSSVETWRGATIVKFRKLRPESRVAVLLLLAWFSGAVVQAQADSEPPTLSISEYITRLDGLAAAIRSGDQPGARPGAVDALPATWRIKTSQRTFEIPTTGLARDLGAWRTKRDAAAHARLLGQLKTLRSEAALFDRPAREASSERARLDDILRGRDFRGIHGPTWFDRLRQRVLELLDALLGGLLRSSAFPTISSLFVYGVVALAVLVLAVWTYRLVRRDATHETVRREAPASAAREWLLWLADAQAAAARGHWRDGIHFAYWCAVSFLEANGAWRPDRARTPREYLRLVPSSSEAGPTLAALTRQFELVWYGTDTADARAFDEAMAHLKKMGCPSA